jgi:hypothetical protein
MVHGPWYATLDDVDALCRDILPSTIGASPLGQCHNLPLTNKDVSLRRSMTLYRCAVQKHCS